MRQVVLFMYTSVDGFIAGPNGEFDSYEPSEEEHLMANDVFGSATTLMFGRVCYEGFIKYWDTLDLTALALVSSSRVFPVPVRARVPGGRPLRRHVAADLRRRTDPHDHPVAVQRLYPAGRDVRGQDLDAAYGGSMTTSAAEALRTRLRTRRIAHVGLR